MNHLKVLLLTSLLALLTLYSSQSLSAQGRDEGEHQAKPKVIFEPHGESQCASGCALSRHPTPTLEEQKFQRLMTEFSTQSLSEDSPALEELLFYGRQTESYLESQGADLLDPERLAFLRQELARDSVDVQFRIVDEDGVVRVSLPPTTVAFDRRFVFEPLLTEDIQPPEASGTVKRVGLNHIWQRI